ncbi:MAG: lytic transglycosylase domain-containing protein [Alphaproteobacteria bacterium]
MFSLLKKPTHIAIIGMIMAFVGLLPTLAAANVPSPRLKPMAPNTSNYLNSNDAKLFRAALSASKDRNWTQVRRLEEQISDKTARDLIKWITTSKDPRSSFSEIDYVVHQLSDWPRMTGMKATGESMILDTRQSPQKTFDWFKGQDPISGEGRAALARAFYQSGNNAEGRKWLQKAWRESKLTRERQRDLYREFKSKLTKEDHAARADHLIWLGRAHFDKAQGLLPLMHNSDHYLMDARMRVASNRSGMDSAIRRVPARLQNDPGLLFERARWRRRKQNKTYALPMYLQIKAPAMSENGKERMWREKKIMAYWAIEQKRFNDAYMLTQHVGLTRGAAFAESEFLAGWLALTKLNQPTQAQRHFERLKSGVSFPVSLSRASYWLGRSYEATNNTQAILHYADASRFSNTFYGFLAAERMGGPNMTVNLPYETNPTYLVGQFEADPRVKAMHLLGEAQEERYFTQFAFHLDDVLETPEHLTLLAGLAKKYGYMKPSLRAAKQASRFQGMLTESGYPMPDAIMTLPTSFDKAFVLAIARQESEFNHRAVSHARAYGLMQMINATAGATARKHRIPYSRSRMTSDISYSARLGALHLHDLLRDYDGSYIMAAVAYNAGPRRVSQWTKTYGDPRKGEIDAVDWLESIPFSETRNYVQRVMENTQVYRARMNGNTAQNRIYRDITVGAF